MTQALTWQALGAKRLHLIDLDGAKTGIPINDLAIKAIVKTLDIPVQIGGGIRTMERADELFSYGIDRVILGTVAIEQPKLVSNLAEKYPSKIIVGIDAKNGYVAIHGWVKESSVTAIELVESLNGINLAAIICTDISTDGTLCGPNIQAMSDMAMASHVPVIASGGIGSMSDLISLIPLELVGVTGVIIGRALYDNKLNLQEAIESMESGIKLDPPLSDKDNMLG